MGAETWRGSRHQYSSRSEQYLRRGGFRRVHYHQVRRNDGRRLSFPARAWFPVAPMDELAFSTSWSRRGTALSIPGRRRSTLVGQSTTPATQLAARRDPGTPRFSTFTPAVPAVLGGETSTSLHAASSISTRARTNLVTDVADCRRLEFREVQPC